VTQSDFLFVDEADFRIADDLWAKLAATERIAEILDVVTRHLESCDWTAEAVDLRPPLDAELGVAMKKKVAAALYTAIEGRPAGLPLFDSIELLGRERVLARLRAACERLNGPAGS
jgi:glutamyl-tRNA synthetase